MCAGIDAAELGEFAVGSHIGQQVVADIELTGIENPGAAVQVRLASSDVYRGANIDMPAVLSSLNMNVMRRDGKQFLHLTSLKPVEADHLHLFVELNDGGRRSVRLATLWFTPDPTPPVPARPAPVTPAAEPALPAAPRTAPLPAKTAPQPRATPVVPAPGPAPAPVRKAAQPRPARVLPAAEPAPSSLPRKAPEPGPVAARLGKPAAPACKPRPAAAPQPDPVCEALDQKNSDLRDQIARLEQKVKVLQGDAKRKVLANPLNLTAPHGAKAKPVPQAAQPVAPKAPVLPKRQGTAGLPQPQPPAMPWGWIAGAGAAVFALIGTIRFWRMKRAKAKAEQKATMKARASRPVPLDPATPVEPTLG
jgi:pilus assembly protein FimV